MKRTTTSLCIPLLLLVGCGGSGGGNGNGGNNPPTVGLDITGHNALEVSQVAYQAVVSSGDVAALAGSSGLTASAGGSLAKGGAPAHFKGTLPTLVQKIPFGPTTLPCAVSGSLTISGDLDNPLTLTEGDTIRADYDNCDDGVGEVIDGRLDFIVDAFSGDILTGVYNLTMTMDLINFRSTSATDVLMVDGDGTATLNNLQAPYVEASVSGNSLTSDMNGVSQSLTLYSSAQTLDAGVEPAPYTMIASGTLDSSELSGVISYTTTVMFEGLGNDYPNTGELFVDGGDSSARITAIDSVNVQIEIDADGDGMVDETIMTTWAEIDST